VTDPNSDDDTVADDASEEVIPDTDKSRRHSNFVQSLDRGLAVLRAFGPEHSQLTLSDVARSTGLTRAAARRFLLTLVQLGYVTMDKRLFWLSPRVLELGFGYLSGLGLSDIAVPHMEELVAAVQESSSIAVLDGDDIVYVVRVPTKRIMAVTITVGTRFPAYCTSMGRVLLSTLSDEALTDYLRRVVLTPLTERTVSDPERLAAFVEQTRSQHYCVVDQELEDGLRSAAVPIFDGRGKPFAALNVSVHASRVTLDELRGRYLTELRSCADRINADLRAVSGAAGRTRVH
jgi:IclR family pca regulon transcriptional regulator